MRRGATKFNMEKLLISTTLQISLGEEAIPTNPHIQNLSSKIFDLNSNASTGKLEGHPCSATLRKSNSSEF
jgi:hypothetical protein